MLTKPGTKRVGFTVVEIIIIVVMVTMLAALAVPALLRARHRSQAAKVRNDLRIIDSSQTQYAIENIRTNKRPLDASIGEKEFQHQNAGNGIVLRSTDPFPNIQLEGFEALSAESSAILWTSSIP